METEKKSEEVNSVPKLTDRGLSLTNPEITQEIIDNTYEAVMTYDDPLKIYIWAKAVEKVIKRILDPKDLGFRLEVKKAFLERTEGAVDKSHIFGAEVTTTKVSIDFGEYTYSDECEQIRKDIEVMKSELEMREKALKLRMTHEINSDIAVKITPESILGIAVQEATDKIVEESFNIKVSFK